MVLIYAQPLTRILALTVEDVVIDDDRVWLRLGRTPLELPDPLAELVATLARDPRGRARTAVARTTSRWLFAGMRVGHRLTTLIAPAGALPPSILADLLGISQTSASKWYSLSGGNGLYVAAAAAGAPAGQKLAQTPLRGHKIRRSWLKVSRGTRRDRRR